MTLLQDTLYLGSPFDSPSLIVAYFEIKVHNYMLRGYNVCMEVHVSCSFESIRARLFKGWIMLSTYRINHYPTDSIVLLTLTAG